MSEAQIIESAAKVLRVFKAMRGHSFTGVSNIELATSLGISAPQVTRAINTLVSEGLVTRLENGRYAHSVLTLQIAQAHAEHTARLTARISEVNQRIAAGAHP